MIEQTESAKPTHVRVGVFAGLYPPAKLGGGPIRSVHSLVNTSCKTFELFILTSDRDLNGELPLLVKRNTWAELDGAGVYYATISSPRKLLRGIHALKQKKPLLLHFNSFFNPQLTILPLLLWRFGYWGRVKILLSPRGEFGEGALGRRSLKKRVYIAVFRLLGIQRHVIWHSTAPHETEAIRAMWGEDARIIYRENDTLLPPKAVSPKRVKADPLRLVYLSRIVEHKGLHLALTALAGVSAPVVFDIYGNPEDAAYVRHCEEIVSELPGNVAVRFLGSLSPDQVQSVLGEYDALLLPTAGENFGHVIAEALAASVIVVTTPTTPWTEIISGGAGLIVERTPEAWTAAVSELNSLSEPKLLQMRKVAGDSYTRWAARPKAPHLWDLVRDL